jgi:hypothetical protein
VTHGVVVLESLGGGEEVPGRFHVATHRVLHLRKSPRERITRGGVMLMARRGRAGREWEG